RKANPGRTTIDQPALSPMRSRDYPARPPPFDPSQTHSLYVSLASELITRMFVVLGNSSLIKYLNGGGHWSWFLQYPLGLKALGHRILWIELAKASEDRAKDAGTLREFFAKV